MSEASYDLPARSGETDPGGKLTSRIEVKMCEQLESAINFAATAEGLSKSEYVRRLLEQHAFGRMAFIRKRLGTTLD